VVVSAAECPEPLDWGGGLHPDAIVLRKPNVGYDFGSWAVGLTYIPGALAADKVILANDSLVGPFATIAPFLAGFESCRTDTWAMTDSHQHFHHLQSFFLGFRGGILQDRPLQRFFTEIKHERIKWDIIRNNELGLSTLLYKNGYTRTAHYKGSDLGLGASNPVITAWWHLLELGFPFVKREIVLNPSVAPRAEWVAREVESVFGARLSDWL
jgi:lipopolysaccharide biosynthesis protein